MPLSLSEGDAGGTAGSEMPMQSDHQPFRGCIEIQTVDDPLVSVATDHLGRFRASLPAARALRIRVVDPSGGAVQTSWIIV